MKNLQITADGSVLTELVRACADEGTARAFLESWRWPQGSVCPHCRNAGDKRISKLHAQSTSTKGVRTGVYFCGACRRQFTVTVGTVLERSHVPISKWLMALFLLGSSKKSLSANQIHRMIGVTYRTAWFMCHRIRFAMTPNHGLEPKLKGTVEVDETFVGPKAKPKTPVVALIERCGLARVKVIASVTQKNLGAALSEVVRSPNLYAFVKDTSPRLVAVCPKRGSTSARYSRASSPSRSQVASTLKMAAIFGPAFSSPMCSQFFRPNATGLIAFSARFVSASTAPLLRNTSSRSQIRSA